jgi:hypothetical protein
LFFLIVRLVSDLFLLLLLLLALLIFTIIVPQVGLLLSWLLLLLLLGWLRVASSYVSHNGFLSASSCYKDLVAILER